MKLLLRICLLVVASLFLVACQEGGNDDGPGLLPNQGSSGEDTGTGGRTLVLGSTQTSDGSFGSVIALSLNVPGEVQVLNTGEGIGLSVTAGYQETAGAVVEVIMEEVEVRFSSPCTSAGLATIDPAVVTSENSRFSTTYTTIGCEGTDVVTAEVTFDGETATATRTLTTANTETRFGNFVGATFTDGIISATPGGITLSAGDVAQLTVRLVDEDTNPFTADTDVFFSSPCITSGLSEIAPAVVSNANGTIQTTYTPRGCDGVDTVTATTGAGGSTLTASVDLTTEQPPLGALQFVSATPEILMLKGTEGAVDTAEDGREIGVQSVVTFRVTSDNGDLLEETQLSLLREMRELEEIRNPRLFPAPPGPELIVRPKPGEASRLNVSTDAIAQVARIATTGDINANTPKFSEGEQRLPIRVSIDAAGTEFRPGMMVEVSVDVAG